MSKQDRIKFLENELEKARFAYYNTGNPIMSDRAYDALEDELFDLDPTNKVLLNIGAEPVSEWKKYEHTYPIGSLEKANTFDEFNKWAKDFYLNDDKYFVNTKLDGISISLEYKSGKLVAAATRGRGTAENILSNAIKMQGVVTKLPVKIDAVIRGEIILSRDNHEKYFPDYENPRNAASGISRRYSGEGCEYLKIMVYKFLSDWEENPKTEVEQMEFLQKFGFEVPPYYLLSSANEVWKLREEFHNSLRQKLPFDIDGIVVSPNSIIEQDKAGYHTDGASPKGKIAIKFANEARQSTVKEIEWGCGNSGRITPVGIVEPVRIAGTEVQRASLYNPSYIQELQLDVGAVVIVEKCNDIIPAITEVVTKTGSVAKIPSLCPSCGGNIELDGENLFCRNTDICPAQVSGRLKNWIKSTSIKEWGVKLLDRLVDTGKVSNISDLYKLKLSDLSSIERMGEKSAKKCLDNLWRETSFPLEILLGSLSIPLCSVSTIEMAISGGLNTYEKILSAKKSDFLNIKGFGGAKAESLFNGLKRNEKLINELFSLGLSIKENKKLNNSLDKKSFCITGSTKMKRDDFKKIIAENGGLFKSSVSKGLDYLIIADPNSTSSKAIGAREMGIKLISEDDFFHMIEK